MLPLALIAALLGAGPDNCVRNDGRCNPSTGRTKGGYAWFEFAPVSGAGMGTACACTTPKGAKGEALTFTRGSAATCTKTATGGLATSGIANGDVVFCSTNQPRVEYDSAGVLGLLVERTRTNYLLRSEELDNAVWTSFSSGVPAPTVTANYTTSPAGTLTAERVQIAACPSSGNYSVVFQSGSWAANSTTSVYLKGTSGSGSVTLYARNAGAAASIVCSFTSTHWSRCSITFSEAATQVGVGCLNNVAPIGGTDTGAADVLVWGAQHETGTYVTSYIPTTSAAVSRSADVASFAITPPHPVFSMAASVTLPSNWTPTASSYDLLASVVSSGTNYTVLGSVQPTGVGCEERSDAALNRSMSGTMASGDRVACAVTGPSSSMTGYVNGVARTPVTTGLMTTPYNAIYIGAFITGALQPNGIVSRFCLDPSSARCR